MKALGFADAEVEKSHIEHMESMRQEMRNAPRDTSSKKFLCRECRKYQHRPKGMWKSRWRRHVRARVCEACLHALDDPYSPDCNATKRLRYQKIMYPSGFGRFFS